MFVFNTDKHGYPAPGAPAPKWGTTEYPNLCNACFEMHILLSARTYWLSLHNTWRAARKNSDKLKPGEDYFAK